MRRAFALLLVSSGCSSFHEATKPDAAGDAGPIVIVLRDAHAENAAPVKDASAEAPAAKVSFTIVQQLGPDAGALHSIWGSGPTDIHTVGDNGMTYDYDGTTWTSVVGTTGVSLGGVWGTGPNDIYAVGTLAAGGRGTISHNDGTGWVEQIEEDVGLLSVWGASGEVWAVGYGGHFYTNTGGAGWVDPGHLPSDVCVQGQSADEPILWSVWGNNAQFIDVAADVDTFFRDDGMTSWLYSCDPVDRTRTYRSVWGPPTSSTSPSLFIGANYFGVWWDQGTTTELMLHEERDTPERVNQFVWGIWGTASDNVVFVGDDGRIMSWDGGPNGLTTWPSPTNLTLYGVWGTSLQDLWVVGDQGLILHGGLSAAGK